jgi:ribose 5-phosphate isomerase RpiB
MNETAHQQLVQQITEQVLTALRRMNVQGVPGGDEASASAESSANGPVSVHPPIGVCTGDYSKFPELRSRSDLQAGSASATSAQASGPAPASTVQMPAKPSLAGIITASQLQSLGSKTVHLDPRARLTPLAMDYVRENKLALCYVNNPPSSPASAADSSGSAASTIPSANGSRWLWWIAGKCPVFDDLSTQWRQRWVTTSHRRELAVLHHVIGDLADRVASGKVNGGVLFVPGGARAVVLANRCRSLRAVVGFESRAVEQAIEHAAANVLIIEYPHVSRAVMTQMVQRFIDAPRPAQAHMQQQMRELSRCG